MSAKLNIDPRYNPKTTILGFILLLIGIFFYFADFFIDLKHEVNHWINGSISALGILLILAPDKVITLIGNFFNNVLNKFVK